MRPSLPQQDPSPGTRRAALARARVEYPLARAYKSKTRRAGNAVAGRVPAIDEFSPEVAAKVAATDARLLANHALLDLQAIGGNSAREVAGIAQRHVTLGDVLGITRSIGTRHQLFGRSFQASSRIGRSFPPSVQAYKDVFMATPKPPTVRIFDDPTLRDRLFAWVRVAGSNPMVLRGIRKVPAPHQDPRHLFEEVVRDLEEDVSRGLERLEDRFEKRLPWWVRTFLPKHEEHGAPPGHASPEPPDLPGVLPARFPVTDAIYQSVMGPDDSLERAAKERRLYLADYRLCDGLPVGKWSSGLSAEAHDKHVYAPMALFAWRRATRDQLGELVPVAIQCHQRATPTRPNPIFTPHDGVRWAMAQAVVQCADANHHEMVWHLGRSHMVMEAVYVCARRTLAPQHPLMILLAQHCEMTLAINDYATKHLIAPGGQVDLLFGSTLEGTLTIMDRALNEYRLDRASPPDQARLRLIDDPMGLPEFPYRDDAEVLYAPFARWIDGYVRLYYGHEGDVKGDGELADFLALLASEQGGNLSGVPEVRALDELAKIVATLCWIGSAQHSALNYTQFPFMAYTPTSPLALYAEAPTEDTPENMLNWARLLAPAGMAVMQNDIAFQLSNVKHRAIGDYARDAFPDARVKTLLRTLRDDFDLVERQLRDRDATRFLPYPYLFPSNAQNSIFI
ncbi:MAG: lipoxygenase family protein [Myxococcota bacterium]